MDMTQISIDLDVYKEIQKRLQSFSDTPNQVLRREFGLNPTEEQPPVHQNGDMQVSGAVLKNGLRLRKVLRGTVYEAIVRNGTIEYNGKAYPTPSGAGVAAVGYAVNGWRFWRYFDDNSGSWKILDSLRRK